MESYDFDLNEIIGDPSAVYDITYDMTYGELAAETNALYNIDELAASDYTV